ncbi:MAG: pyruvate ferredoxin oxidoreductase [Chloroflexi bacterium]|nr:pyruvate ferredoxin oxidoreductase [Chloroflexota bacterium]
MKDTLATSPRVVALNGASLVAEAIRQTDPDVVAAYPITPQTILMEAFSQMVADGRVRTELVTVESEHAAMSVLIGACAAGARVQSATSGAGLAFMWELLWCASGMRLPIVMHLVSRSLSAPLNILGDHSDVMGARDTGWVQLFAEDGQEAYDNALQAVRIAEHPEVLLPVMSAQDGFSISHSVERAEVLPDELVRSFIGTYAPAHSLLDIERPATFGANDDRQFFALHKRQQYEAMERALGVVSAVGQEYGDLTGRSYGLLEAYRLKDAELAVVLMGSAAGAARAAVDKLRAARVPAGLLKLRLYRPFPAAAVAQALAGKRAVAALDRSAIFGAQGGALFLDVCSALATHGAAPRMLSYVYGLGGRDTVPSHVEQVFRDLEAVAREEPALPAQRFLGLD